MANKEIHIPLKVDDQGSTKKKTEEARALREELEKASKVAENMGGGSETLRKAKKRSEPLGKQLDDYDKLRGVSSISGGTARNFSDQARGLGGLVRLYATFAANIYAVSTAFNALKEAANLEKMQRAAETLSTRTGTNLNSLAKSLQNVTDKTLSFQEAVQFSNIGTAAGLGAKQIENLTKIAKGAANALGRDVSDSIRRIIQGTAKQEQEILDELGIFVKAKTAYEDYAKARNMKVDDLSSQQRVLAYAEAVAKAGEKWKEFAEQPDPYAKLVAQGKDALAEILKAVNSVFIPILSFIAESKDAIISLIALISGSLVKKALPELKNFASDFFRFDSALAKAEAQKTKNIIIEEYTSLNKKIEELEAKRAKLKIFDFGDTKSYVSEKFGYENVYDRQSGRAGISAQKVSTKIFGADGSADLTKYKQVADVEKQILAAAKEQLRDVKDKDALLAAMIQKEQILIDQETKKIALGAQSKAQAESMFKDIQARVAGLATEEKLIREGNAARASREVKLGQINDISKSAGGSLIGNAALAKSNDNAAASAARASIALKGYSTAADLVGAAAAKSAAAVNGFTVGLAANRVALQNTALAAEQGLVASFKNLGTTIKATLGMVTASVGAVTGGVAKAGAAAGAVFSGMASVASSAFRLIGAAFGPLMIAWTVWELFGDKLIEFFKTDTAKQAEKNKKAWEEYAESVNHVAEALAKANKTALEDGTKSAEEYVKARTNAYRADYDAFVKYEKAKADAAKEKTTNTINKDITKGLSKDEAKIRLDLERNRNVALGAAQDTTLDPSLRKEWLQQLEKVDAAILRFGSSVKETGGRYVVEMDRMAISTEALSKAQSKLSLKSAEQGDLIAGVVERVKAAAKAGESLGEALAKKKIDSNFNFKSQQVADFALKLKRLGDETNKLGVSSSNIKEIQKELSTAIDESGQTALHTSKFMLGLNAAIQQAAKSPAAFTDFLKQSFAPGGEGISFLSIFDKQLKTTADTSDKLTKAEKARLAQLRQEIQATEAAIKGMQSAIDVEDKISSTISNVSGKDTYASAKQKDLIAKEEMLAKQQAKLSLEEVTLRNKGPDGAELRKAAEVTYQFALQEAEETAKRKNILLEISYIETERSNQLKINADYATRERTQLETAYEIAKAKVDLNASIVSNYMESVGYLKEEVALYNSIQEKQKLIRDYEQERKLIEQERSSKLTELDVKTAASRKSIALAPKSEQAAKNKELDISYINEEARINALYDDRISKAAELNSLATTRNALQVEHNSLLAVQAKEMSKVNKMTANLEKAFSGTALEKQAKGISALFKSATTSRQKIDSLDKKYNQRKEASQKRDLELSELIAKGNVDAMAERIRLGQEDVEASQRYAKEKEEAEFEANMAVLSSFKSMMSEKTAGYRILDGIEKAMHAYKMVMQAKELASDIAATAQFVANGFAKSAANATTAITNQGSGDPYTAFARIAAMIALMASITGKRQGGAAAMPGGITAKDRQETQGTGMAWKDGKKVESGGGVFGDAEAKSESIKKSLEVIKENTIEGLSYDNKMLKALESINRAISGVSTSLYRIPGIRTGSAFGTVEGSSGSKSLWGIFGSKKQSVEIIDSGVKLAGTFKDLAKGGQGLINFYETVQTTSTSSGFLGLGKKTSTSIATNVQSASPEITQAVASVFSYATDLFKDVGSKIGKTAEDIDTALSSISFDQLLSLRGLKGEDLEKEFNAVISSMLDSTADALFSEMKRFQKFGEGMLETVVRVVDANKKLNDGLNAIGQSSALKSANKALGYDVTEKLLEAVGGLDAFTEQIGFFRDEFLTEAERLAPIRQAVTQEMSRLGYSMVDTREEFKALVQSLDLTIPAQQELYASLMQVAKGFAEVYEATEQKERLKAEEYRTRLIDLEIQGLELLGNKTQALAAQRALEIEEVRKLVPEQAAQIEYYKKVIWAIEDSLEVRNAEIEVLGALGFTYDQMLLQREMELQGLTEQVRAVKRWQFAVEDFNNSQDLMIELLNKSGKESQAVALSRERELKGLNSTDKLIKRAIYALEDEEAIREKLEEAKQKELELKEKEYQTIKDTTSATRDYIRSLKDYRNSLLKGNLSTLTPLQKYEQTRMVALETAAKAMAVATTEEEKRAQKEARDKLQGNTSDFLEAARVLYASGTPYTQDFNTVLSTIDKAIAAAGTELSDAEKQLKVLDESKQKLQKIEENTKSVAQLTAELTAAQKKTADALAKVPDNLSAVYKMDELYTYIASLPEVIKNLPQTLLDAVRSVSPTGNAVIPNIPGLTAGTNLMEPINNNPNPEQEALVDQAVINIQNNSQTTNDLTRQLITEINNLKEEIVQLKAESRANTEALITAEFRSGNNVATQVQEGFERAANTIAWNKDKNTVVLR